MTQFDALNRREGIIPHAIKKLTPSEWKIAQQRAGIQRADMSTVTFHLKNKHTDGAFVVGADVRELGQRFQGIEKYKAERGDVYGIAGLIKMFPDGHNNIIMGLGHPPNSAGRVNEFIQLLGGRHTVTLPNKKKIEFRIPYIKPYDENEVGLVRTLSRSQTYSLLQSLEIGSNILIVDIGGRIGSMYYAELGASFAPFINWNRGVTFEFGIEDIKEQLNSVIRDNSVDFNWDVPDKILEDFIRSRGRAVMVNGVSRSHYTRADGSTGSYHDLYNLAITPFMNRLEALFNGNIIKGASDAVAIVNTGGGSGALFETLNADIYGRICTLADAIDTINLANMRGMLYALYFWAERSKSDPRLFKYFQTLFALVALDAGNSFLKIGVIE